MPLEPAKKEAEELDRQIAFKREEIADCDPAKVSMLQSELTSLMMELNSLKSKYQLVAGLEAQIVDIGPAPLNPNIAELRAEADNIQQQLIKLAANKRYDELSEQVTKDKFELENELEILKIWIKLTDANGLQSTMMNKPFEDLASDMSNYLSSMFGSEVTASFNLVSKANSFSFGLVRNGQYIEFDYLSSGEKCLFTLALILCILDRSQTQLRTIVIDDILDHLDGNNAEYLFDTLKKVDSVQFILAGVKECKDEGICFAV